MPALFAVLQSGDRSVQARYQLDSLVEVSRKIGYVPGVARGIMMTGAFYWGNPDTAIFYLRLARQYSKEQGYNLGYFMSTHNIGTLYLNGGVQDSAIYWLTKAMAIWTPEIGLARHAKLQLDFGSWYSARDDYKHSLQFLVPAMISMRKAGDTTNLRSVYNSLGVMYTNLRNFEKAKYYYEQTLAITPESYLNGRFWTDAYNNLGTAYLDIGKNFDSALTIFRTALSLALNHQLSDKLGLIYMNMGITFIGLQQSDSATFYLRSSRTLINKFTRKTHIAGIFINYGSALLDEGKIDSAKYFIDRGMDLLTDGVAGNLKVTGYELLFQVDSTRGKYVSAIRYLQQGRALTTSLHNKDILMKVAEKEYAYELDLSNSENDYLKRENTLKAGVIKNQRLILFFAVFIILMIAGMLLYIAQNRKKLQHLNQTKDKFLSIISHDLRSPFSSLLGLLTELHNGYDEFTDKERKQILSMLETSSQNTYNLLENLLEWTNSQQGKLTSNPKLIEVRQHVEKTVDLLKTRADKKGVELRIDIAAYLATYADPMLFDNTMLNITNNAIKFTPGGGTIIISSVRKAKHILVCCTDNGIGIPANYLNDLFRLDGKVKRRGTDQEPGTGLGLILCKEYVGLMNGKITVVSNEKDGTKVCIELPAAP
jgi:signal transduction histidine kinase